MSIIYTQHTVGSVFVGQTGHVHTRVADEDDTSPTALECTVCEPYLVREGWVYSPEIVPLTDRQERDQQRIKDEGQAVVKQVADALAATAAKALVAGGSANERPKGRPSGRPKTLATE